MKQEKVTLKKIKATVMPQTTEALQILMERTGLTIGEVIDRLTLHIRSCELQDAVWLAREQVIFSVSALPEDQVEEALREVIVFFAGYVPTDQLKDLEKQAIESRAEKLEEVKKRIEERPAKDKEELMRELSVLEKIRVQK